MSIIVLGMLASLAAGAATGVGALPVFFMKDIDAKVQNALLGFAAGVMLAASFFSLILPGLDAAEDIYGTELAAILVIIGGLLLGVGLLWFLNDHVPHDHFILGHQGPVTPSLRRVWLFVIAITIHNFPEGLAVGVGFGGGDVANGTALAIGIGLQNMPEGLAVAVALLGQGYKPMRAFYVAALTGLVEPVGGILGVSLVTFMEPLLPWGLAFAAGAMLFVILHEIVPETHRQGFENTGTIGAVIGLVVMMFLDVVLG